MVLPGIERQIGNTLCINRGGLTHLMCPVGWYTRLGHWSESQSAPGFGAAARASQCDLPQAWWVCRLRWCVAWMTGSPPQWGCSARSPHRAPLAGRRPSLGPHTTRGICRSIRALMSNPLFLYVAFILSPQSSDNCSTQRVGYPGIWTSSDLD